ncbi:MAG: MFS transporter [Solirubrobacteraceae bacterium]|nr:MFS transporter [Solirubrobacteraceae bacterium]
MPPALRSRPFRWIGSLYSAALVLEWVGSIALMVLVYEHTQSTTAAAVLLVCKQVVPGALIPLAGATLDRLPLVRTLSVSFVVQATFVFCMAALGVGPLLFVLAAFAGFSGGIIRSLLRAGVARALPDDLLVSGNAVINIAMGLAGFAGPALGAALVSVGGSQLALQVVAAGLALCGTLAVFLPAVETRTASSEASPSDASEAASFEDDAVPMLPLAGLLGLVGFVTCVFAMDEPALLAFSEKALGAGVGGYSAIIIAWGIGITLGSLLFTRLTHWPLLRVYVVATALAGLGYVGLGLAPSITIACLVAVVGGIGNGMDWVAIVTLVQRAAPRGREAWAATRLEAVATAGPGLGVLAGGILADAVSPRASIVIPGLLALSALLIAAAFLRLRAPRRPVSSRPAREAKDLSPSIHGGQA